jgi:hypothetical protein
MPREEAIKMNPGGVDGAQTIGESVSARYFMNAFWISSPTRPS